MHRIAKAIDLVGREVQVPRRRRTPLADLDTYRRAINNHLLPVFGELRIGEANNQNMHATDRLTEVEPGPHCGQDGWTLVTGNVKDFLPADVRLLNPSLLNRLPSDARSYGGVE